MKKLNFCVPGLILPVLVFFIIISSCDDRSVKSSVEELHPLSNISLNGIVDVNDYAGSQPDLIDGISRAPSSGKPLIRHVYAVSPDVIGIIIDEKACILSNLKPYRKQRDDVMILTGYHGFNKLLVRGGDSLGYLAGPNNEWMRPFNEISGSELDLGWISDPSNLLISSHDDANFNSGINPLKVYRKTTPDESVTRLKISRKPLNTIQHHIFLKLPAELIPGKHYEIQFRNNDHFLEYVSFLFNDSRLRSEAIHVNLYGYEPYGRKVAVMSAWMGDGGAVKYPGEMTFRIINAESGGEVFNGKPVLKKSAGQAEYIVDEISYNHNKSEIYEMDFSSLDENGRYRLVVDGIGCSFDFVIDEKIWENCTKLVMKGLLHQRAGIELGPPYTDYIRPRNLHPADGHIIHKCDPEKFFNVGASGQQGIFKRIQASILEDTSVPEMWGGWMDAGDYDRRMTHLNTVRKMMYLFEMNPVYYEDLNFNIPESANEIPDILDEALWCLDIYRRTQGVYEEGGVSWWIESVEHPRHGETSWLNSLPTAVVPPTPEACLEYAASASQMARLLKKYDPELASLYERSSFDAMAWVEKNPDAPVIFAGKGRKVVTENLCYLNFYRLTGDETWHQRFLESLKIVFPEGIENNITMDRTEAAGIYSLMDIKKADPVVQQSCFDGITALARALLAGAEEESYGILRLQTQTVSRPVTLGSKILPVVLAHKLTGDKVFETALSNTIQFTMGLNPLNRSYISGLGVRSFTPYHHDWHADMLHVPAGLPNFGPSMSWWDNSFKNLVNQGLYPVDFKEWPLYESCFNQMWMAPVNEFTPDSPMGEHILLFGYLASIPK